MQSTLYTIVKILTTDSIAVQSTAEFQKTSQWNSCNVWKHLKKSYTNDETCAFNQYETYQTVDQFCRAGQTADTTCSQAVLWQLVRQGGWLPPDKPLLACQ